MPLMAVSIFGVMLTKALIVGAAGGVKVAWEAVKARYIPKESVIEGGTISGERVEAADASGPDFRRQRLYLLTDETSARPPAGHSLL